MRADLGGVGEQAFFFHDAQRLDAGAHRQRVAAEGRAVVAGPNTSAARGPQTTAPIGTPEPRPLASGITSGRMPAHWCANHLPVRPMPHCTSSSISSQSRSSQTRRTCLQVVDRRRPDAALALDHLEEDGDDVRVACGDVLERRDVVERHAHEAFDERAEAGLDLGVAGRRQRRDRAAVEGRLVDDDLRALDALVVAELARDLERRLVRLEAGVAEEDVAQARQLAQLGRELLLQRHEVVVRAVDQLGDLVVQRRHELGVARGRAC